MLRRARLSTPIRATRLGAVVGIPSVALALALALTLALGAASCRKPSPEGPIRIAPLATVGGAVARSAALAVGGLARPALVSSATYNLDLPERSLLTFGMGVVIPSGTPELAGWYRLTVTANGRTVADKTLNPRTATGWRDVSVDISGGRGVTLAFDLRLADRDGAPLPLPPGVVFGISDPVVHDLAAFGRAKGIVLVSIDTLRRDHVGTYGYARPTTPTLDALAARGLLLEDAVSTSSWTLPAHLSMLTSVDPAAHGGIDMRHAYNRGPASVASVLKGAGFATHAVTSHLYVSSVYGLDAGFDSLDFHQDRRATDVANRAMDLLDRVGDRPFFLFLHLYDPHWHYDPPEEARGVFAKGYAGSMTGLWGDFSKRTKEQVSAPDLAHILALYDEEIRYTDGEVGRVLSHLRARGLEKSTLVAVTSDHGEEFLEHGSWEHQKTLYEEVIRIPMIFAGPGVAARREGEPVTLLDVAPTLLAWAGVAAPASFTGRNLLAPLTAKEQYGETDHTTDKTHKLFLRAGEGRWKTILSLDDKGGVAAEEWFDLAADGDEQRSTVPAAAAADSIRRRAIERWKRGRGASTASAGCVALTPEQVEKLAALGYVEGGANAPCTEASPPPR